jgi:CRP-like cAMP-binding protein
MKPGVEALRGLPILANCTPAMLARLNAVSDLARLGPDEVLFRQGDRGNELNILISGYAVTTRLQPNGDEAVVDVIEPITPIGLPAALLDGASPIGSRTVTSARVLAIAAAELRSIMQRSPPLAWSILDHALTKLQDQTLENAGLKLQTAAQRLANYLLSLVGESDVSPARFVLPFEKRLLAAKLGCSQENLSRIFGTLRSVGVTTRDKAVVVRSVPALQQYAGTSPTQPSSG